MKKILFVLCLLLISEPALAKRYAFQRQDGSLKVVDYIEGSSDSLVDVMRDQGVENMPRYDVPDDVTEPARYLKAQGGRIVVDSAKKQADIEAKAAHEAEKDAIFSKLKISREEWEKIRR